MSLSIKNLGGRVDYFSRIYGGNFSLKELYTSGTTLSEMINWTPLSNELRGKIRFCPPPPWKSWKKLLSVRFSEGPFRLLEGGVVLFTSQPSASQPFTSHSVHFYSQGKYPIHSHRTCTHFTCIFAYIWLKSTPWKIKSTFHFLLCFSSSKGTLKVQKVHLKYSLTKRIYIFFHLLLQRIYDLLSRVL